MGGLSGGWCCVLGPASSPSLEQGPLLLGGQLAVPVTHHPCLRPGPVGTDPAPAAEAPPKVQDVEDFVPADGLDHGFLEDTAPPKDEKRVGAEVPQDSDR